MELTGDTNTPALPMKEAEVNHLRRLLAWMRCEWTLDPDMQRGCLIGASEMLRHGLATQEQAIAVVQHQVKQINRCPAYVQQAVKMLTRALRDHDRKAGILDAGVTPLCMCKDRTLADCPGEWEPGCDLGANEKFVRVCQGPTPNV